MPKLLTILCDDGQRILSRVPGQPGGAAGQQALLEAGALIDVPQH